MATGDNAEQFVVRILNTPEGAEQFAMRSFNVPDGAEQFAMRSFNVPDGAEQFAVNIEAPPKVLEYAETITVNTTLDNQQQFDYVETAVFNTTLDNQLTNGYDTVYLNILEEIYVPPEPEPEPDTDTGTVTWFDGASQWLPALIYDGTKFSNYRMWDGSRWVPEL